MSAAYRPNILVLCGRNKRRSRTAEHLFKNDARFAIRSAGLSPQSARKVKRNDLDWADLVFVMENRQRTRLRELFPDVVFPKIRVLQIPDVYAFMDPALVPLLKSRIDDAVTELFSP